MAPKVVQPTADELKSLRTSVISELEAAGVLGDLDSRDVKKFEEDDKYASRFVMHNFNDMKKAHSMAVDTLKWRKEMNVNDLTVDSVSQELLNNGLLMAHNRDVDGCKMLIFTVQNHLRGTGDVKELRKLMIYWIERLEREEQGKWITVVFDMHNTGLKNMDMDMIQYVINLFKFYYPYILNYILVLDMPWILNAMWKIIRSWLPPEAIEKIKFLDKKTINTYVTVDQCLTSWGGTDNYTFTFVPEKLRAAAVVQTEMKKVTFAEDGSVISSKNSDMSNDKSDGKGSTMSVDPADELMFSSNQVGATAPFVLQNHGDTPIAFKIKTTSPEKFRVKPAVGVMDSNESKKIMVTLTDTVQASSLVRDKFLVVATPTTLPLTAIPDNETFKNVSTDLLEFRLRVGLETPEMVSPSPGNHIVTSSTQPAPAIVDKLNQILSRQSDLEQQVASARRLMFFTLVVMLALLSLLVIASNNLTHKVLGQTGSSSEL